MYLNFHNKTMQKHVSNMLVETKTCICRNMIMKIMYLQIFDDENHVSAIKYQHFVKYFNEY